MHELALLSQQSDGAPMLPKREGKCIKEVGLQVLAIASETKRTNQVIQVIVKTYQQYGGHHPTGFELSVKNQIY